MEQSRRDDLESIAYILIYFASGSLPWMNLQIDDKEQKYAKIHQLKKNTPAENLCEKLPTCFVNFLKDVKNL
jgi:casein kinase I family protein HRR25